jgi:hypothetical protein
MSIETKINTFGDFLEWELTTRDSIDVKGLYIDCAQGDHVAGILLSQIVYWYLPSKRTDRTKLRVKRDGVLWIAKGREDWYSETRITARQFDRASKILVELGIIEKKIFKFAGSPTVHIRIIQDKFIEALEYHKNVSVMDALDTETGFIEAEKEIIEMTEDRLGGEYLGNKEPVHAGEYIFGDRFSESGNSISPNGDNHIQRDLKDLSFSSSLHSEEKALSSEEEEKTPQEVCVRCGDRPALDAKYDLHERCGVCLFTDAWSHYIGARAPAWSDKDGKRNYVGIDNIRTIQSGMIARLKGTDFRKGWIFALERAGHQEYLKDSSWFNADFFLRNDNNWRKIIKGTYDFKESEYPASQLARWLARKQAGLEN